MTENLSHYLDPLGLGGWQYHPVAGSTNDLALAWAENDAYDGSLVLADSQTAGRGRHDRHWITRPGVALAMSLILRPLEAETPHFARFTALAALGLVQALSDLGLDATVKWPNDILIRDKKVAGVLVEADWQSGAVKAVVIGLGVNVLPESVPPDEVLRYPATSVADELGRPVNRWALLAGIIQAMQTYRVDLTQDVFLQSWNHHLAFREQWVSLSTSDGTVQTRKVLEVAQDGCLVVEDQDGTITRHAAGEIEISTA